MRWSPSAPIAHTIGSLVPSVVVAIGEPTVPVPAHHASESCGGSPGTTFTATRFELAVTPGHAATPRARNTTYTPSAVRYSADVLRIGLAACSCARGGAMPPRSSRPFTYT